MIHKMVRYRIKPEHREAAKAAVSAFVEAVRSGEPDTLQCEAFVEPDGVSFVHFMTFRNAAAEELHRRTPHVIQLVEALYPKCEVVPIFTELSLVRSSSLPALEGGQRSSAG